jgi:hypothetical protein
VVNDSDEPIFECRVGLVCLEETALLAPFRDLPPREKSQQIEKDVPRPLPLSRRAVEGETPELVLFFRDAGGQHWKRRSSGELQKMSGPWGSEPFE